jgi:hypothetical protein
VDGDSGGPPHFPTLPWLTSSANANDPTQQPPCADSTTERPEERLPSVMTVEALILRANSALLPIDHNLLTLSL